MNPLVSTSALAANGASTLHDLFALTDEQILQIEPEAQDVEVVSDQQSATGGEASRGPRPQAGTVQDDKSAEGTAVGQAGAVREQGQPTTSNQQPPPWLAAQMKDPWSGEEARELWNGVQQARQEAAAYRAAFATPEDARALKELYPGGVNEARDAAERARVLDDFDRAYFGGAGKSAQEVSASRAQLAQTMLREDPAAFREMVFAGLRALEESGAQPGAHGGSRFSATSAADSGAAQTQGGLKSAPTDNSAQRSAETQSANNDARLAAYGAFEKAANEDLERSVGGAIERTLAQALPNASRVSNASGAGAQHATPLQSRLGQAIRQDVEAALKGDRQLSEQIAQILSSRRFDNETRAQVVRLIDDRARQLVPGAAKRVLSDWTQTTLAAHRGNATRADPPSTRREVEPASSDSGRASVAANSPRTSQTRRGDDSRGGATRPDSRRVDYRKLSDEQILDL